VVNDEPTAAKPFSVQPSGDVSAPEATTVVEPDVTLMSSAKNPIPPAAGSVA